MRLKRLELYGYKSFASRAVFEFGQGITAIVGPNGSGKSNIADAIRWVMGEQSFRLLRADTTSDMIFAGSRRRSRLGMAEVLITLDNADGSLPVDYTEVTVGRRAYRSGENEYLLNGQRVRLRDILDILGGAGLARSTYTVIGQGLVDEALALRPEARRALFEEAAGIGPHLRKRSEALRRMEETEHNLERAGDILADLRPRAGRLRRQAERAEEYLLLEQDLRELQRIWYGYHWQCCRHDLGEAIAEVSRCEARLMAQREHMRAFQQRATGLDARRTGARARIQELRDAEAQLRREAESEGRQLAVTQERRRLYAAQLKALVAEHEALALRRTVLQDEIDSARTELAAHEEGLRRAQDELAEIHQRLVRADAARGATQADIDQSVAGLEAISRSVSQLRARLEQGSEAQRRLAGELVEMEETQAALAQRRQGLEERRLRLATRETELLSEERGCEGQMAQMEAGIRSLAEALERDDQAVSQARRELDRLAARHDLLARLREELTGYAPGVRRVLEAKGRLEGIVGTVAELMHVPQQYEEAIASALGSQIQNLITERWEDAAAAIAYLKREGGGWATFLPLDTIRPRRALDLAPDSEVLGVASRLVRYDERLRPAFELLLGRVLVVNDLEAGRRLLGRRSGASLYVTLDGEQVRPSGSLSGGRREERTNLLAQEREWRELAERLAAARARFEEAESARRDRQEQAEALRAQRGEVERDLARIRDERSQAHRALTEHEEAVRQSEREAEWLVSRAEGIRAQLKGEDERVALLQQELAAAEERESESAAAVAALRQRLDALGDEPVRRQAAELETRVAVARRTVESQRRLLASHIANLEQIAGQVDEKANQAATLRLELDQLAEAARTAELRIAALHEEQAALRTSLGPPQSALSDLEAAERQLERERDVARERLHEVELERERADMERDRVRERQTTLEREIEAELGPMDLPDDISHQLRLGLPEERIELPDVLQLPRGLGDEIRQLRARMRRLGSINPEAPQEYERLLERQTFIEEQITDLKGAIASLHEIIADLDEIIERDFCQTVEAVDRAFQGYFQVLFGGGDA
ncbi:MAG: chromosome segregation protein SMC, partial [Anaerolineae bacterium]|nr:chromosome segregation protein SMC [Anaerolineae bacterium]